MKFQLTGDTYAVRLEVGEELLASIAALCERENIKYAEVSGIGAVSGAVVGLFSVADKKYYSTELAGPLEMVSLSGSVTEKDGKAYLHLHASFSDDKCRCFGGHLNSAVIGVTGEIFLRRIEGSLGRRINPETGLNIFDI